MRVDLVNTGSELLLGEILNTHAVWIAEALRPLGLRLQRQVCIPDGPEIGAVFAERFPHCDVLIVTGGLGPTLDDVTRESLAELLGLAMTRDEKVVAEIEERLRHYQRKMPDSNYRQADVPAGAEVLSNPNGTAPGLYLPPLSFEGGRSPHVFLLPGPPRELRPMFRDQVVPRLLRIAPDPGDRAILNLTTHGIGESRLTELLDSELEDLPGVELGYRLGQGFVNIRLIGPRASLTEGESRVRRILGPCLLCTDGSTMEQMVVRVLAEKGETLVTAESCTGGAVASQITDAPGASKVFLAGYVTYANEAKTDLVGVPPELIAEHGAVSAPVAQAMAEGALERSGATHAVSLTGIAGPSGGTDEKPVGTVFIALATEGEETWVCPFSFPGGRDVFKLRARHQALELVRRRALGFDRPEPV